MLLARRKPDPKPAMRPLTDYERLLDQSRANLLAQRSAAANSNSRRARPEGSGGVGRFLSMITLAIAAAIGTQYYLGLPNPDKVDQTARQFMAGAHDFLQYLMY